MSGAKGIRFGALVPRLKEQIVPGKMSAQDIENAQAYADDITRLSLGRLLTEAETKKARGRLVKWLEKKGGIS